MKIVRFLGGLGNQLFQYAFYLALSERFKSVKADLSGFKDYTLHNGFELERVFGVQLKEASNFEVNLLDAQKRDWFYRKCRRLLFVKAAYQEERKLFSFDEALLDDPSSKLYWGYWQHHRYVELVKDSLLHNLRFPAITDQRNADLLASIHQAGSKAVAIHVRRGDYLTDPYLSGLATEHYFNEAIDRIRSRISNAKFFIFSDDIPWCKAHLRLDNGFYVDWNKGEHSFRDMQLMSQCSHAILSNSSFSWWGAWLMENSDKVIVAPAVWYRAPGIDTKDMHPERWIRI